MRKYLRLSSTFVVALGIYSSLLFYVTPSHAEASGSPEKAPGASALFASGDRIRLAQADEQASPTQVIRVFFSSGTDDAVEWSAVPLDGQAIEAVAAVESVVGPFETTLEPGRWKVNGDGPAFAFEGTINVRPGQEGMTFVIPAKLERDGIADDDMPRVSSGRETGEPIPDMQFSARNDTSGPVRVRDRATGLSFILPPGWASDEAYRDDGQPASVGLFDLATLDGFPNIALNPMQWTGGPCLSIEAGDLCHDDSPQARAALPIIRDSFEGAK